MKINQSFIFNNKNEEIKMLEKPTFNRYILENIQKQGKIKITSKDFTKLNSMSYEEIVKEKTNLFKKITNGIYCLKISDNEIIGILINKTIEDFKRIYEKNKNKTKAGKEIREKDKDKRLLKIEGEKEVKISNFAEQLNENRIISNEIRNMKVDKEMVKNNVKRMAIVGIAAVAGLSLFACKKTEAPIPNADIRIDVDANINDGNSINEKEETIKGSNNGSNVTITPEEAARGKTVENTRRTVNEYGVTIYGKPISEQEAINKGLNSEIGIKNDKKRGIIKTYTEYYSDAYGGIVYISTINENGSIKIYNENGKKFLAGDKPQNDIEVGLANYRMGNAMAEAIDRTYNK